MKTKRLSLMQKVSLSAMAVMTVLAVAVTAVNHKLLRGVPYGDTLLRPAYEENRETYTGKVGGVPVTFVVTHESESRAAVEYRENGEIVARYGVDFPLAPIQTELGSDIPGLLITKNGEELFSGGYSDRIVGGGGYINADGSWSKEWNFYVSAGGDQSQREKQADHAVLTLARKPETVARGNVGQVFVTALIGVLFCGSVAFPDVLFRWRMSWYVQDADKVEPSDWEEFSRVLMAVLFPALLGVAYYLAVTALP